MSGEWTWGGPIVGSKEAAHRKAVATGRRIKATPIKPDDARHGTASFYRKWGCRCDACKAAASEYEAKQYAAKRAAQEEMARLRAEVAARLNGGAA